MVDQPTQDTRSETPYVDIVSPTNRWPDRTGKLKHRPDIQAVVQPNQRNWLKKVDMAEFAINSSVSATTKYSSFELNGGYMPSIIKELQ